MAKYKVGDKVRIVRKAPLKNWNPNMNTYLGMTMTIIASGINEKGVYYFMDEDRHGFCGFWYWYENMISGLAEPERKPCTVELRFDGMITTATLKRGGRGVKTAEARCNPKDTYSRAEGARVAVERLFEKKRKEDKPKESKPKIGDKFVVIGKRYFPFHSFAVGDIVTLEKVSILDNIYRLGAKTQYVNEGDLTPYKETSK